jgi:pyruvate dehydrogenase E2 component (dihydrolipoamide acetyltransferase)
MNVDLVLVRVGMNMEAATIARWCKQPGDSFLAGDPLYEIETDKVTYTVEAPFAGVLTQIRIREGESAKVGQAVGMAMREE